MTLIINQLIQFEQLKILPKKTIELELEETQEKYKLIAENVDDVIWILNPFTNKFTYISPSVEKLRGYTVEEVLNQDMKDVLTPESQQFISNILTPKVKAFIDGNSSDGTNLSEIYQPTKNGEIVTTEVVTKVMVDKKNQSISILGVSRNVTERKKAEKERELFNETLEKKVKERTEQLENANKDLESFAYSISHDLRAPLRHIDAFTILLKKQMPEHTDEAERFFDKIIESITKMSRMIDDLLKFSRLGRKSLEKTDVDLNTLVEQIINQYKIETEHRKIEFKVEKLPIIKGDYNLLQVAFENLISNAIKFTSKKEQALIEIGSTSDGYIYIKDNGAGFDINYIDKLFGVFQRLHTSNEFEGNGIGLANVKQIIQKHGGSIRSESEINKGSTFYVYLS